VNIRGEKGVRFLVLHLQSNQISYMHG